MFSSYDLSSRVLCLFSGLLLLIGVGCAYQRRQTDTRPTTVSLRFKKVGAERAFSTILQDERASLCISFSDDIVVYKPFEDGGGPKADLMSVTKSIAALAVGRAVDEGLFESIDLPLKKQLPDFQSEGHEGLTLRHLLTMTAGLTEAGHTNEKEVYAATDTVALAQSCRQHAPPGSRWDYDNRSLGLIAGALKSISLVPVQSFTQHRLFEPLDIREWEWRHDSVGNPYLMAGLSLATADLVKFGQLVANRGIWHGQRILSAAWIESLGQKTPALFDAGYGLLWWVGLPLRFWAEETSHFDDILWAQGYAHQYLFVDQASNTVIAILNRPPDDNGFANNDEEKSDEIFQEVVRLFSARRAGRAETEVKGRTL